MIDLWFGDSYVLGAELAEHYGEYTLNDPKHKFVRPLRDRPDRAYPHLVSSLRQNDYINFAQGGSSIEWQLYQLTMFCKHHLVNGETYTAFFCLPFQERRFFLNNNGDYVRIKKRGFFDTTKDLETIDYTTTLVLNQMYVICKLNNIVPYFMPIYVPVTINYNIDLLPNEVWLIDKSSTLVTEAWGLHEPVKTWRKLYSKSKTEFMENVYPCDNHPNLVGHQRIADLIVAKLTEKEQCKKV